jgi:hypothetical protein
MACGHLETVGDSMRGQVLAVLDFLRAGEGARIRRDEQVKHYSYLQIGAAD